MQVYGRGEPVGDEEGEESKVPRLPRRKLPKGESPQGRNGERWGNACGVDS